MNPYATLATGPERAHATGLAARLAAWHDAMVAHERRLRGDGSGGCDDECPHVEARGLWAEAVTAFGERAHDLAFLRSRATSHGRPGANAAAAAVSRRRRHDPRAQARASRTRSARPSARDTMTEAEL